MSYDINFWRQPAGFSLSPQETYAKLCAGEPADDLLDLPVDEINAELQQLFLHYDPTEPFPLMHSPEQERDQSGSVEVFASPKHFRFDLRGEWTEAYNLLSELMSRYGCPLYDPQQDRRYATEDGTAVGEVPQQEPMTSEQQEEIERIKAQFLAKLGQPQMKKKGCGAAAVIAMFCIAVAAAGIAGLAYP